MNQEAFEKSIRPGGAHHRLNRLVGEWSGIAKTWFEPGVLADESAISGRIRPLLEGRFVMHEYWGALAGQEMNGLAVYGFQTNKGIYQGFWIDNLHMGTAMMFSWGKAIERGFSVTGSYLDTGGGPDWGWRTAVEIIDPDHITITAYNITPDGEEAKAVEIVYRRVGDGQDAG